MLRHTEQVNLPNLYNFSNIRSRKHVVPWYSPSELSNGFSREVCTEYRCQLSNEQDASWLILGLKKKCDNLPLTKWNESRSQESISELEWVYHNIIETSHRFVYKCWKFARLYSLKNWIRINTGNVWIPFIILYL